MENELNFAHGPCGVRNFSEDELVFEAKRSHYNSDCYRPSFLIRIHNLTFKRVVYGGVKSKNNFQSQDLTINIRRGEICSLGQPDSFDKAQQEGQKIDDMDNTEFNLFGDSYSPFVSDEHFAVGRDEEDDKVWIRDLNSKQGTFVNGERLTPQINHKLKEGDIVSLGISHLHPKCKLDKGIFWVFKYKEVSKEEEIHLKTLYSQVFGNSVILSNILETIYDPYKHLFNEYSRLTLTKVRSVSKFWNEISIPILRKKLDLTFKVNQERGKYILGEKKVPMDQIGNMLKWNEKFHEKDALFSSLGLRNLKIKEIERGSTEIRSAEVKLFENFFRLHRNQISNVVLEFSIDHGSKKHKNREKVLQHLFEQCKSIVHFRISKDCSTNLAKVPISTSTKALSISCVIANYGNLLRVFPNVTEIRLESFYVEKFLTFVTLPQNTDFVKEALKNLKVLKMSSIRFPFHSVLINCMINFPIKIEEFDLQFLYLEQNPTDQISNVISAFSDSLKILKFTLVISNGMLQAGIRLPKMDKLEKLEITLNNPQAINWIFELGIFQCLRVINLKAVQKGTAYLIFLKSLMSEGNRKYFPKLERAFASYGQLQGKNFAKFCT